MDSHFDSDGIKALTAAAESGDCTLIEQLFSPLARTPGDQNWAILKKIEAQNEMNRKANGNLPTLHAYRDIDGGPEVTWELIRSDYKQDFPYSTVFCETFDQETRRPLINPNTKLPDVKICLQSQQASPPPDSP